MEFVTVTFTVFASLPPRGAWIEILVLPGLTFTTPSLPPRGAWIEMADTAAKKAQEAVAPPTGSVD